MKNGHIYQMKISGSLIEIKLIINNEYIELQMLKRNVIEYKVSIMEFSEIEYELTAILEENNVFLPKNRLNKILEELEGNYLSLIQEQQKIRKKRKRTQKSSLSDFSMLSKKRRNSQKILLMGGKGKSSIYNIIFHGLLPHETRNLPPTKGIKKHEIELPSISSMASNQKLNLWETGSEFPPENCFKNTSLLLFIINAYNVKEYEKIRTQLHKAIALIKSLGSRPNHLKPSQSNIFCFIHQMDKFPNASEQYNSLIKYFRQNKLKNDIDFHINFFATSIFDSSIYSAWTKVLELMMPKSSKLNQLSDQLKEDLGLYAALVIEKRTGLPICSSKTLLDDAAIVGSTNRVIIMLEKIIPEFELTGLKSFNMKTRNGILEVRIFNTFYILVLLYPISIKISSPSIQLEINNFIEKMTQDI